MRYRSAAAASLAAVVCAGAFAPATAAPAKKPKPVTKTYTAEAFPGDPTPTTGLFGGVCEPLNPAAKFSEPLKVPFAGTLKIDMTGFLGDWDLAVFQGDRQLAFSAQDIDEDVDRPEKITLKVKRAGVTLEIRSCNFSGGPTADMKYVLTPA
jgi:hypothetical protein